MHDFTQYGFSEEASRKAAEILDFTTCMRSDGSTYGTGGKCRLGTETQKRPNLALKAYIRLMKRAKERGKPADTTGYHAHHAFPKSIFKNKETANKRLVWLTHGEHFQAHHMIYQALKERYGASDPRTQKMAYAVSRMANGNNNLKLTKKQYEEAMKINAEAAREQNLRRYADPAERLKRAEENKKRFADPAERERLAKAARENYEDDSYKRKWKEAMGAPGAVQNRKEGQKKRYENPNERLKRAEIAAKQMKENGQAQLEAMKAANQKLNLDPEHRKKYGAGARGKLWYRKGDEEHRFDSHPGEGWEPGRVQKYWWNDGTQQVYQAQSPGDGFGRGMLKRKK